MKLCVTRSDFFLDNLELVKVSHGTVYNAKERKERNV